MILPLDSNSGLPSGGPGRDHARGKPIAARAALNDFVHRHGGPIGGEVHEKMCFTNH